MNGTTQNLANRLGLCLVEDHHTIEEDEEFNNDLLERFAKGQDSAYFVEVYANDEDCEWYVRYVREGVGYRYAGHIIGEDYPAFIPNEVEFRSFLKEFKRVYGG